MATSESELGTPPVEPATETRPISLPPSAEVTEAAPAKTSTPTAAAEPDSPHGVTSLEPAVPAEGFAPRKPGLLRKLLSDLSKVEVVIAVLGLVVTVTVFVFSSFEGLRTSWNLVRRQPLDVSLRFTTDQIDVIPGKAFVARVAVENYTDWYKPYVKLNASLAPAATHGPAVQNAFSIPRLDPPDIVRIDPCGRVYVDVAARINIPGKYVLTVASRPLYNVPAVAVRLEEDWTRLLAATPQQGEPCIRTILVVAHRAEDFGDPTLVEVMPDKTNCRASVTLTAGQSYPYGLRISASTRPHSRTWFHAVDPAMGTPEASADTSEAAIANGAYIKWKVERMEALETREFSLFLDSSVEHDPTQWKEIIKGIQFSVEVLRESEKP